MSDAIDYPVIGFRSWRFDDRPGVPFLRSQIQNHHWDLENEAKCMRPVHLHRGPAPAEGCECGLYAFHDLKNAKGYSGSNGIVGIVRGWGNLRIHRDGWRSQHAEILAIIEPDHSSVPPYASVARQLESKANARTVAEAYRVPLIPEKAVSAMQSEFGRLVPEDIRPDSTIYAKMRGMSPGEEAVGVAVAMAPIIAIWIGVLVGERIWHRLRDRRRA